MARNGSGTYSLPTPATPIVGGTTILASDMNTILGDLASALTASISADGQTPAGNRLPLAAVTVSQAGDPTTNAGQLLLNGNTSNRIDFNGNGLAAPAYVTRSVGTKIVYKASLDASNYDYATGLSANVLWHSAPTGASFQWQIGGYANPLLTLDATGTLLNTGSGIGYGVGVGGTVTQITSKNTAVTLNTLSGTITMNNASLAANGGVSFQLNNGMIGANDLLIVNVVGFVGNAYYTSVNNISAGNANIMLGNRSPGALADAVQIRFAIIKASNS